MFSCHLCDKSYTTQNSLTRHAHNHRKGRSHVCRECHVIFSRKDLLVRHSSIHKPPHGTERCGGRRIRCHTACIGCRQSRVKCNGDGKTPCTSCMKASKECTFSATSHRISTDYRLKEPENTVHNQPNVPEENATLEPGTGQLFDYPAGDHRTDTPAFLVGADEEAFPDLMDSTNFSPLQTTAWPWLHEDLFFQSDTANDWCHDVPLGISEACTTVQPILLSISTGGEGRLFSTQTARVTSQQATGTILSQNGTQGLDNVCSDRRSLVTNMAGDQCESPHDSQSQLLRYTAC